MSENSTKVIVIVLVGGAVALLLCCGVGFGLLFWLGSDVGGGEFARQVQVEVEDNPVMVEHIGNITSFEWDLGASIDEPGADTYVFHVTGDKGSGTLRADCITIDADSEDVPRAELILDTGESFQLFPDDPLN